jgi:hypothetical protein
MSNRYHFTDESWRILENIILHEQGGSLFRIISVRDCSKNMEIAKAWDMVAELLTYHTGDVVPKAKLNEFYRRYGIVFSVYTRYR